MIRGINHAAFMTENMEKSLQFYCDILGFKKAFELSRDGQPWIVYIKIKEGQFIELFYGGESKIEFDRLRIGYSHLCLEVADIHEIADHLKASGLTLDTEPKQGVDKNWQCWVRDPDGNRIEFMQIDPASPHMNC
ncbi:VOC family protein [Paenibacillus thalictri]|uniref:VOC family protein n=1 Tax=Paenibacillus thalictri TaxID=2527873 RepID=A0A4Q9E150_9BACL|nr:VOC family protein [Paenibacillus thalictri]TBL81988.1 VOC family protein [Paenibacillus thalictri]